jgi:hypothetical protein
MASQAELSDLVSEIRRIVVADGPHAFDKRRAIEARIRAELNKDGEFFRTPEGRGFYFDRRRGQPLDVEQSGFQRLVASLSGLSLTENPFACALDLLQTRALRSAPVAELHAFSHYDTVSGCLAVSDGGPGIWRREPGGRWELSKNGQDGLYFLADPEATPWAPDFGDPAADVQYLRLLLLSAEQGLAPEVGRHLVQIWLCHQYSPALRRTRIIPCFLGGQGSGKSTAMRLIGRLLVGPNFDVTGVQRDKEDAFVAAVTNRMILGLDNVDSKIPWLPDALALYATGQRYRLRKLYTTNEEASYTPRAIVLVSSRDPRFNRPDVAERLLPLYFSRPPAYKTEDEIFHELENRRGTIMGAVLLRVGEMADRLRQTPPRPVPHRMADFASFGDRVLRAGEEADGFLVKLEQLESQQSGFAADNDGVVLTLRIWLDRNANVGEVPVGQLFEQCRNLAEDGGFAFPKTVQAFGRYLSSLKRVIELELEVRLTERYGQGRQRFVSLVRKPAPSQ